jgi:hypothetical protein
MQKQKDNKMEHRSEILEEADALINGERQAHYGKPSENFQVIADMWATYLNHELTPSDVCHMMALLKIARLRNGPHKDSSVDGAGYLALGAELGRGSCE